MRMHLVLLLTWTSLCTILDLVVFGLFLFAIKEENSRGAGTRRRMSPFVAIPNLICVFGYQLCSLWDLAHFSYSMHWDISILEYEHADLIVILQVADAFYFTSTLSIYVLFLSRLVITFRESDYRMSTLSIALFSILFCVALCNMVVYVLYIGKAFSVERNYIISLMCLELAISLSLTFLFVYKLRQLTVSRTSMSLREWAPAMNNANASIQLDAQSIKMLSVLTRYAILSITAICFGLTFYAVELYQILCMRVPTEASFSVMYACRELEVLVCMLSLYLSFVSTRPQYDRVCGCCHSVCFRCWVKSTKQIIAKQGVYYRLTPTT